MGQFETSDGARIAFADDGEGRALVLLHGLMANRSFFAAQSELEADFRIISVDLRGHGESRSGSQAATVRRMAADIEELLGALDVRDAIGIGWSLGASVLWHVLTGPAGDRFSAAIVIDMTPRVLNDEDWSLGLSQEHCSARADAIRCDFKSFAQSAGAAIFAQPDGEDRESLRAWAGEAFARNDPAEIGATWASLVAEDFRPLLPLIRQPTLIVHGTNSHLYGADTADHLVAALPNAHAVAFDRSGHSPHIEQPELFNRTVRGFAATLPRVRETQATN
ncbi:MAG: alpha/beta hydrolase [Alphaproteobacteria bacterium]|nr:alpha/beta hydrolase [Alphaproteobacteria bacterium]